MKSELKEKISKICVVCNHNLDSHILEEDGWRCNAVGGDGFQCECFLRKKPESRNIDFYNFKKRRKSFLNNMPLVSVENQEP